MITLNERAVNMAESQMKDTVEIVKQEHADCAKCEALLENAVLMMKVTGSVGTTSGSHEIATGASHSITVKRKQAN